MRCDADERQRLEHLCRYVTRPLANDSAGEVVLRLKKPWRNSDTHIVTSPLEFMRRLAALVLWPYLCFRTTALRRSISPVGGPVWVESCR